MVRSARSNGPFPDRQRPLRTAFSEPRAEGWSNWRGAPAVLVRGAVVVGLVAAVVAAVSGAFMTVERPADAAAQAPAAAPVQVAAADPPPPAVASPDAAPAAAPASVDPAAEAAPLAERMAVAVQAPLPEQPPPAEQAAVAPAPSPVAPPPAPPPPAQPVVATPAPPPPQPAAEAEMVTAALPARSAPMETPAGGSAFAWPDTRGALPARLDHRRIAERARQPGDGLRGGNLFDAAAPADQSAFDAAAARRAGEFAAADFIAPIPKPRPDPPARVVRTSTRGRLPPPPNCGSKHAYYRYNSAKQPVWYCR